MNNETNMPTSAVEALRAEWGDAYRAFKGAFDTPIARKRDDSEYANDARNRLARIDELLALAASQGDATPAADGNGGAVDDTVRLGALLRDGLTVKRMADTGLFMLVNGDGSPVTGEEFDDDRAPIDAWIAARTK